MILNEKGWFWKLHTTNESLFISKLKLMFLTLNNLKKKMSLIESKLTLKTWWVTGIVDSEGNFSINYNINTKKCTFSIKVTQNANSAVILYHLKEFFKVGNIYIDNKKPLVINM